MQTNTLTATDETCADYTGNQIINSNFDKFEKFTGLQNLSQISVSEQVTLIRDTTEHMIPFSSLITA